MKCGCIQNLNMSTSSYSIGFTSSVDTAKAYIIKLRLLHLAALTSYKNEIYDLNSRLQQVRQERDQLRKQQSQWNMQRQKMQQDFEDKLQSQTMRITELQSVIAELTRKLNKTNGNKIIEEDEEEDEDDDDDARSGSISDLEVQGSHACSECSCENCDHHLDDEGPNQVNFLATAQTLGTDLRQIVGQSVSETTEEKRKDKPINENDDLHKQLSRVLGALESRIEDRKNSKVETEKPLEQSEADLESNVLADTRNFAAEPVAPYGNNFKAQISELLKQIESLKRDKRSLEKQLHTISVQGYVYQKGNTTHVEEEFSKLRQENNYLRSKLRKAEQEVEDVKASNITIREERERLKKKNRVLLETCDGKQPREPSPIPSTGSTGSGHRRSHSTHMDRPHSPHIMNRSASVVAENRNQTYQQHPPQQSASFDNRSPVLQRGSPVLHQRSASETRKHSFPSPSHSTHSLPTHPTSAFVAVNSKGYAISPDSSLRRGQHMIESSDLGSSIGDESLRSELSKTLVRNLRGRIPETLLATLMTYHNFDQMLKTLVQHFLAEVEEKSREGVINVERLESRMAHLQSQNDLLQLSLDECKQNAERLSLLCGKYESNSTAWSLALQNTEQLIETYEVMLQLQESEADIYAANCHAAGIGNFDTLKSLTSTKSSHSNISIASSSSQHLGFPEDEDMIKSIHKRKDVETQAKMLLHQLDKKYENMVTEAHEEDLKNDDLSYKSRTSTGSSQNSDCTDALSKVEQHRLRDYIKRLKTERGVYKGTVVELESVHEYSDHPSDEPATLERAERMHELNTDIETAVLLQEMQALKEERAELKHRIYLLEKEKRALELKMNSREAQEQAYIVHIEHLKSEVKEQIKKRKILLKEGRNNLASGSTQEDETLSVHSGSTHSTTRGGEIPPYNSPDEIPAVEASKRERKFKQRIQELVDTLEKLSKNSEIRHKQTAEYISDLKRANGALVTAYEKAKKRHASRLKKFEQQLVQMAEKYQIQVRALKEQIVVLKETPPNAQAPQTETSL